MTRIDNTTYCDGCGIEVPLSSIRLQGRDYCCQDCAQGLVCKCGEWLEVDERREPHLAETAWISSYSDVG